MPTPLITTLRRLWSIFAFNNYSHRPGATASFAYLFAFLRYVRLLSFLEIYCFFVLRRDDLREQMLLDHTTPPFLESFPPMELILATHQTGLSMREGFWSLFDAVCLVTHNVCTALIAAEVSGVAFALPDWTIETCFAELTLEEFDSTVSGVDAVEEKEDGTVDENSEEEVHDGGLQDYSEESELDSETYAPSPEEYSVRMPPPRLATIKEEEEPEEEELEEVTQAEPTQMQLDAEQMRMLPFMACVFMNLHGNRHYRLFVRRRGNEKEEPAEEFPSRVEELEPAPTSTNEMGPLLVDESGDEAPLFVSEDDQESIESPLFVPEDHLGDIEPPLFIPEDHSKGIEMPLFVDASPTPGRSSPDPDNHPDPDTFLRLDATEPENADDESRSLPPEPFEVEDEYYKQLFREELAFLQPAPPPSEASDSEDEELAPYTSGSPERSEISGLLRKLWLDGINDVRSPTPSNASTDSSLVEEDFAAINKEAKSNLMSLQELLFNLKADHAARKEPVSAKQKENTIKWGSEPVSARFVYPKQGQRGANAENKPSSIAKFKRYCKGKLSVVDGNAMKPALPTVKEEGAFIEYDEYEEGSIHDANTKLTPTTSLTESTCETGSYLRVVKNTIALPRPHMVWDTDDAAASPLASSLSETDLSLAAVTETMRQHHDLEVLNEVYPTISDSSTALYTSQRSYGTFTAGENAPQTAPAKHGTDLEQISVCGSLHSLRSHVSTAFLDPRTVSDYREKENKRLFYGDVKHTESSSDSSSHTGTNDSSKGSIRRTVLGEITECRDMIRDKIRGSNSPRRMGYLRVRDGQRFLKYSAWESTRKLGGGSQLSVICEEVSSRGSSARSLSLEKVKMEVAMMSERGSGSLTRAVGRKIVGKVRGRFGTSRESLRSGGSGDA